MTYRSTATIVFLVKIPMWIASKTRCFSVKKMHTATEARNQLLPTTSSLSVFES